MPDELAEVNYGLVGDGFERGGIVMGLGLTRI